MVSVVDLMVHKKVPSVFFCCNIVMLSIREFVVYYRHKRSLGQGNVFTPVCHSVHSGHRSGRYASNWNAYLLNK